MVALALLVVVYFLGVWLGLGYTNRKFESLRIATDAGEVKSQLGGLFVARSCNLDAIPAEWRNKTLERAGSSAMRCRFLGLPLFEFYVLFDENEVSYLKIPSFE